jgi:hypothetical protein
VVHLFAPQDINLSFFDDVIDGLVDGAGNVVPNLDVAFSEEEVEMKECLVVFQLD